MKRLLFISLLLAGTLAAAEGLRKEAGACFLEPLEARDSVLVADQLRYGFQLENVPEGTPLALPELQFEKDAPVEILGSWQLDSVRVSKRKETPARYDIRASLLLTTWMGGSYTLPDIPILMDGDTLVFKAPAEPLEVTELPVDMETFQAHDIKDQVKFPYTLAELFPWIYGTVMVLMALAALILYLVYREKKKEEEIRQAEPAHIRALRQLDRFRGQQYWKPDQQKAFYSGVTDALREYIASRYGVGALEMTTAEIFRDLKESDIPEDLYQEMQTLFERADFVKFAKFTATDQENATVLPQAIRFVTTTYQTEIEEESNDVL